MLRKILCKQRIREADMNDNCIGQEKNWTKAK